MKPKYTVVSSFGYAFSGIVQAYKEGHNIRIQTVLGTFAIALGLLFQISSGEWLAVLLCIGAVISGECVNTALEDCVDLACPGYDPVAKAAKDMAAGAVLVMSIISLIVAIIIFVPRILVLFGV